MPSAYQLIGVSQIWRGRPVEARESLERAVNLFDSDLDTALFSTVAPVVPNRSHLGWALWICGYPDQALKCAEEALALAMRAKYPFSIAFALQYLVALTHMRREYHSARERTETLCAVGREAGFPIWLACGIASKGRLLLQEGDWEGGSKMMREATNQLRAAGGELIYRYMMVLFADGCLLHRRISEGMRALDEAREGLEQFDLRMLEPEIYRLQGEFTLLDKKNPREAEELFRTALRVATAQGAKSWELRAATSLGRLMINSGRHDEARDVIEPIYRFFTEGFETGDLMEAHNLLKQSGG